MRGCYVLLVNNPEDADIRTGGLGTIRFLKGQYVYVGSALNGIEARVRRHIGNRKKIHWHIDYLLRRGKCDEVYVLESDKRLECVLAERMAEKFYCVPNFGSSDCHCRGHLFHGDEKELISHVLKNGMRRFELPGKK
ncbi:MAG: GIY-YIG nuclease family protein [Thermoplasmata archaeon]|nr:MAG: GIY-YIG nuclease family protein [Thermoplasmata archaeon]